MTPCELAQPECFVVEWFVAPAADVFCFGCGRWFSYRTWRDHDCDYRNYREIHSSIPRWAVRWELQPDAVMP